MGGTDLREALTRKIVDLLERGELLPWQKPWTGVPVLPYNALTGKAYKGINRMGLALSGYDDPRWLTFRQVQTLSRKEKTPLSVRKGAKGTTIERWIFEEEEKRIDPDTGRTVTVLVPLTRPRVRTFSVFNAAQIEGLPPRREESSGPGFPSAELSRHLLSALSAKVFSDGGDRAFYRPSDDTIHLPAVSAFRDAAGYHSTLLHELVHWTGHESRLAADFGPAGSERYAFEELRAEIGSYYLNGLLGLSNDLPNHASYVADWLSLLKEDPNALARALRLAGKAEDFILDRVLEREREPGIEKRLGHHLKSLGLAEFYGRKDEPKTLASPERVRESPHAPSPENRRLVPDSRTRGKGDDGRAVRTESGKNIRISPGDRKSREPRTIRERDDDRGR